MKFKTKIWIRVLVGLLYLAVGVLGCILAYTGVIENAFVSTLAAAFGIAGLAHVVRNLRIIASPDAMRSLEIKEKDERNVMLAEKARSLAFGIYITAAAVLEVALFLRGMNLAGQVVAYNICAVFLIYVVCYWALRLKN